jgi:AraC-like DNA-binding protein
MDDIIRLDTVYDYNQLFGVKTLNPLVSVVDFSATEPKRNQRWIYGFYAVMLKDVKCGDLIYGRNYYDYQEGTVVAFAPGQVIGIKDNGQPIMPKGWALVFQPDLLRGTELGRTIRNYTFFSYEAREALHLSDEERQTFMDCLMKIKAEVERPVDKHSRTLIVSNIELLLNYCTRFYDRQFITRENVNQDLLSKFENLLDTYFDSEKPELQGLPSVKFCASELNLSANYFGDLIKKETGTTAQEHIQMKVIDLAKERVIGSGKSVSEIAYGLGFNYPQHFSRMFKKQVGMTPNEYRESGLKIR